MRHREVEIELSSDLADALAAAIGAYAYAAFPDGGSECAQVSREALLDSARRCGDHDGGALTLRRPQMPQLRAAVDWYFAEVDPGSAPQGELLKTHLSRTIRPK